MKRYFGYIAALALLFVATSCTLDDFENQGPLPPSKKGDKVTVIGRITRFTDYDVATRGVKNEDEAKLTSMAMAIFPVNDDGTALAGNCVYWQYTDNQAELLFTVDRGSNYTYNARYAMYVFTNMNMSEFGIGSSLDAMMKKFQEVKDVNIPENGFPMMGSLGDTFSTSFDKDTQVFILSPTDANGDLIAPTVNGTTQTLLTIPMKAMYAKVNFTIQVTPDQTIEGNYSPQFRLEECIVNNVPSSVDFSSATNDDDAVLSDSFSLPISGSAVASGANKIALTFYLPERLLTPATTWENYDYPFGKGSSIRDEDLKYRQRFKGKLLGGAQQATNVVISGRFRDHQNHYWDVDYTIHLGADNYGDFNILRNSEYNNYITIRGIQSSSDMSDKEEAISIDHRVNVERSQPAIISLRRETLLDSHFEVRPLRVRKSDVGDVDGINAVKVEVVNPETTNWMRLERSFGDGTPDGSPQTTVNGTPTSIYIDEDANSPSYGKRKFFTYNLIDGVNANATDATLKESTEVILPITDATECCWIYVDECTEIGDEIRAGIVRVTYGNLSGSTFTATTNSAYPPVSYIINQRKLFQVTKNTRTYNIEYEEEYLHNFDADDNYGQTQNEGMVWGLNNLPLSHIYEAVVLGQSSGVAGWFSQEDAYTDALNALDDSPMYDYYMPRDIDNPKLKSRSFAGYDFCNEIITEVNGGGSKTNTDASDNIDILRLDEQPKSAIEYCFNKNKRDNKGHVVWQENGGTYNQSQLNWYLPAIDEIEEIVTSSYQYKNVTYGTYVRFLDFQNKLYWSSQPAFDKVNMSLEVTWTLTGSGTSYGTTEATYYRDDIDRARATRVNYLGVDDNGMDILTIPSSAVPNEVGTQYGVVKASIFSGNKVSLGDFVSKSVIFTDEYAGNRSRTSMARVRCVRKAN